MGLLLKLWNGLLALPGLIFPFLVKAADWRHWRPWVFWLLHFLLICAVLVLLTYLANSVIAMLGAYYLLHSDAMTIHGSLVAMLVVGSFLIFVVTFGVSVSALSTNTLVSIAIVWLTLYGGGFLLSQLPGAFLPFRFSSL